MNGTVVKVQFGLAAETAGPAKDDKKQYPSLYYLTLLSSPYVFEHGKAGAQMPVLAGLRFGTCTVDDNAALVEYDRDGDPTGRQVAVEVSGAEHGKLEDLLAQHYQTLGFNFASEAFARFDPNQLDKEYTLVHYKPYSPVDVVDRPLPWREERCKQVQMVPAAA